MHIADLHCDTVENLVAGVDIATGNPGGHIDIPRLRAGGVGLQAFAAYVSPATPGNAAYRAAVTMVERIKATCTENPEDLALVTDTQSASAVVDAGKVGVLLTVENGHAIENKLENLEHLRREGVRSMAIVHSRNTEWAASCSETSCTFDGLSEFGQTVVQAMNEMGMIVDVSHCHESAFWKVAKITRKQGVPFIASHSNAWEICSIPRNLKDDQIREIADQGGVIGINFFPAFLDQEYSTVSRERAAALAAKAESVEQEHKSDPAAATRAIRNLDAEYRRIMEDKVVTVESIVRHINHIVKLVGVDHVAFGSDFDGIPATPVDVTGSDAYPGILRRLSDEGYAEEDLEKIAWSNFMRVLRAHG